MKKQGLLYFLLTIIIVCACNSGKQREWIVTPTGDTLYLNDSAHAPKALTYKELKERKNLRLLAYISPKTYYKHNGHPLGTQYLILMQYAQAKGFEVTVDSCKDSTEVDIRLKKFEGDFATTSVRGKLKAASKELQDSLDAWCNDTIVAFVEKLENDWLNNGGITRHSYPMYIDLANKKISQYDNLFKNYAKHCNWDWLLLAAQCYQESTFDKDAFSWVGARGLMQIMPQTAEKIQLPFSEMFTPDMNIKAAVRLINELNSNFSYIKDLYERQNFILAAYNGGIAHVHDAMALAAADTVPDSHCWQYVAPYFLLLEQAKYYTRREVRAGYMRGSETYNYVRRIREIYEVYSGVRAITPQYIKDQYVARLQAEADAQNKTKQGRKGKNKGRKNTAKQPPVYIDPRVKAPFRPPLIGLTNVEKEAVLAAWKAEMQLLNPTPVEETAVEPEQNVATGKDGKNATSEPAATPDSLEKINKSSK